MHVVSQHFDEADDLFRFGQNRTSKIDVSVITSNWFGKERMHKDKFALTKYI